MNVIVLNYRDGTINKVINLPDTISDAKIEEILEKKFKMNVFLTGFFGNSLIAIFLVYIGTKLNLDLYLGAVIVFTGRLLNNFTVIRHEALGKIDETQEKFKLQPKGKKIFKKANKENNKTD